MLMNALNGTPGQCARFKTGCLLGLACWMCPLPTASGAVHLADLLQPGVARLSDNSLDALWNRDSGGGFSVANIGASDPNDTRLDLGD